MWYVVQVEAGNEAHMKEILKGFLPEGLITHIFYPLYESSYKKGGIRRTITKILFPGYLFLDMENSEKIEKLEECLKAITEFHYLLTTGKICTPISSVEQAFLTEHTDSNHVLVMSRGYMMGREVIITEGAFEGFCGELKYVDRHNRFGVISVKLGEREVDMQFGLEIVKREIA